MARRNIRLKAVEGFLVAGSTRGKGGTADGGKVLGTKGERCRVC